MKSRSIRVPAAALAALFCACFSQAALVRAQEQWASTWAQTAVGDWVQYTTKDGPGLRFEVSAVDNGAISYKHIILPAGKDPIVRLIEKKPAADIRLVYQPGESATWRDEEITINGVKLA